MSKALARVAEREPERVGGLGVLFGWSRGAFAARDILYTGVFDATNAKAIARFRGLVLMAAAVTPDAPKLKSAGITRVVMAAGDLDGSAPTMKAATATLRAAGLETRYVSLGKIAHVWPDDFEARMAEPIAWAAGTAR
jgi:predicted esterase